MAFQCNGEGSTLDDNSIRVNDSNQYLQLTGGLERMSREAADLAKQDHLAEAHDGGFRNVTGRDIRLIADLETMQLGKMLEQLSLDRSSAKLATV